MSTVRNSIVYSTLESWVSVVLQVASGVVIARLLNPEELGVFAVAAVFASLASTFRDFGVGEYLIQKTDVSDDAIRAALTVNIVISWLMSLLLLALAPVASEFYRQHGVADVMRVQAISFLLIPFGAVTMAWFRRELNFKPMFVANIWASVVSFAVAVGLALSGYGYMSLAWSSVAGVAVTVGVANYFRGSTLPRLPGVRGVGEVLRFGRFVSSIYLVGELGRGAPDLILGRLLDLSAVGMLGRAVGLVEIFQRLVLRAVMRVCLPYFAQGVREEGSPLGGFLTAMSYLTTVGWVFLLFMALASYSAIRIIYGVQWMDAVELAQILCVAAAIELAYVPAKEAMLSVGRAKESSALQLASQGMRVAGIFVAVPFGLVGACWGLLGASLGGAWLSHRVLRRTIGLRWSDVVKASLPGFWVALLSLGPVALMGLVWPADENNYVVFGVVGATVTASGWGALLWWIGHPLLKEVSELISKVWQLVGRWGG